MPDKFIRHGAAVDGDGLTSAIASTATVTFDTGTDTVTWTGHTFANGDRVYFSGGTLPTGLAANVAYFVRDQAANTFKVATTAGGAAIDLTGTPSGTTSGFTSGAWNTLNYFEGTASPTRGAFVAGDVVYIRSKDASDADITRTLSAAITVGSAAATSSTPKVTWVLDRGVVWPGVSGSVLYQRSNGAHTITFRAWNEFLFGEDGAFTFKTLENGTNNVAFLNEGAVVDYLNIDITSNTSGTGPFYAINTNWGAGGVPGVIKNILISARQFWGGLINVTGQATASIINPRFNLVALNTNTGRGMIAVGALGGGCTVHGGRVYGAGATTGATVFQFGANNSGHIETNGFLFPAEMTVRSDTNPTGSHSPVYASNVDGQFGAVVSTRYGQADSRQDGFYPTLNATFPNPAASAWSWKVYCPNVGIGRLPFSLPITQVNQLSSADQLNVRLELLVGKTYPGVNKKSVWAELYYIDDATGVQRAVSSHADGALDDSAAVWTPTVGPDPTYGPAAFDEKKIELTTPTAVRPGTNLSLVLFVDAPASSATAHLIFVDPAPAQTPV